MRLIKRFAALLVIIIAFFLLPAVETSAQAATCAGLSAADCKILSAADANAAKETSFNFSTALSMKYKLAGQSGSMDLKGTGAFAGDPSGVTPGTPDLSWLKMSADLSGPVNLGSTLSGNSVTMTFHTIIVDNIVYYRDNTADQWKGFNLLDAVTRYQNTNPLGSGTSANVQMLQNLMTDPQVLKAIAAIPNIKGFITTARTRNSPTVENQKQIEFVTTYNLQTLLKAKEIYPLYNAIIKASGSKTSYSNAQLAQVAQVLANALSGTSFKITRWVGSTDNLYHSYRVDFVLRINGSSIGQASVSGNFEIHFQIQMTGIGDPVNITAPDGAEMIDTNP